MDPSRLTFANCEITTFNPPWLVGAEDSTKKCERLYMAQSSLQCNVPSSSNMLPCEMGGAILGSPGSKVKVPVIFPVGNTT